MPVDQKRPSRLLIVMFVIYLALLVWLILWKLEKPWVGEAALLPRPIKHVPFVASGDAGASNAIGIQVAVIGTVVSVIAIAALIVSPLRYGPQHDVIVPRHATGAGVTPALRPWSRMR